MKNFKPISVIGVIFILIAIVIGLFYWLNRSNVLSPPNKVAATIFPLYDIVRNISGDEIETVLLLTPGASPHTFDLSPKEVRALSGSAALFTIGHGLDNWAIKIGQSVGINDIYVVDKNIELMDFEEHEDEDEHKDETEHEEYENDPHYWLSVGNALIIAEQVKNELSDKFPEKRALFEENFENYSIRLGALDQEIRTRLTPLDTPPIATFHNAWKYFARDYPITIAAVFEEFPGKEPTPKYINEFQEKVKRNNVKVIFAEPQFSPLALEPIAKDLGVGFSELDPLGGVEGRETYEALMLYNVNQVIKAFE